MCDGFPDQEYQSAAVQRWDRQKIQNSQVNSKHQGDVQHIHQYILPAVILGTFVGLANNIYRDAYRATSCLETCPCTSIARLFQVMFTQ